MGYSPRSHRESDGTEHRAHSTGKRRKQQPGGPAVCGFRDVMQGWGSAFLSEHVASVF